MVDIQITLQDTIQDGRQLRLLEYMALRNIVMMPPMQAHRLIFLMLCRQITGIAQKVYASSQEGVVQDGTSHGYANGISLLTDLKRIRIAILLKPIITGWVSHASSGHSNTVN